MRIFRSLSLWVLAPVLFVIAGGLWFQFGLIASPDQPPFVRVAGTLFYAGAMTAFFSVWIARARRRAGGAGQLELIGQGIRDGQVPADADVPAWADTVNTQYQQLRRNLWLGPVVFGLMMALSLWLAATQSPYWWLGTVFFAAFLISSVITTPRGLRKLAVVRDELARRSRPDIEA